MLKRKRKFIIILIFILIIIFAVALLTRTIPSQKYATDNNGWNLILVNENHCLPDDYTVKLTELDNGTEVDSRIHPYRL